MKTRPHPSGGRAAPTVFGEYRVCPIVETANFGKGNMDVRPFFRNRFVFLTCRVDLPGRVTVKTNAG
jgi:hypothetical protein